MFLNALLGSASTDKLNGLSDKFMKDYPDSPLTTAVQKFISYKLDYGDYGFALSIGGGYNFNSGRVTDYINQNGGMTVDFSFYLKKWYIGLYMMPSFGKIKKDIEIKKNGKIWEAGNDISILKIAPVIGYNILKYKRFNVTPFAGISFNSASPSEDEKKDDPYLKDVKLGVSVTPVVGMDVDYRIKIKSSNYAYDPGFLTVGLRTAYYPNVITNQGGNMKGELFFVGLTLKVYMFDVKKVY
jgi:hypothetical protein